MRSVQDARALVHALLAAEALFFDARERLLEVGVELRKAPLRRHVHDPRRRSWASCSQYSSYRSGATGMKYTSIRDSPAPPAAAAPLRGPRWRVGRQAEACPACSHALVMIDATAVIASFNRFSNIGRVSGEKSFKVLIVVDIAIADGLFVGRKHIVRELRTFEQGLEHEITLVA